MISWDVCFYVVLVVIVLVGAFGFMADSPVVTYGAVVAVVLVVSVGVLGRDDYLSTKGQEYTYETVVVDKYVDDGYSDNISKVQTMYCVIAPVFANTRRRTVYIVECSNPIETGGKNIRFKVNRAVYRNTEIGMHATMKVSIVKDRVAKAVLMGNSGVAVEAY